MAKSARGPKATASTTHRKEGTAGTPIDNDNLERAFVGADLVDERMRGTSRYLDVVQWNLEWFGAKKSTGRDHARFDLILEIMGALNADLFVLQEVAGPSRDGRYPGALDGVAKELGERGAGDYVVYYTDAGGEQRVAMMWDRNWLRARTEVKDLFEVGTYKPADGKDPFAQRTPLYGYFVGKVVPEDGDDPFGGGAEKFDFQVLGVHLKAMADGYPQRLKSAEILADWMSKEAPNVDGDVLIMGDWNAPPDDKSWKPFHDLEVTKKVKFKDINDPSDFSYLWLENRTDKFVSRIDLTAISLASADQVVGQAAKVVRWKPIEEILARAGGNLSDRQVVALMRQLKEQISDHMPTVSRFYFTPGQARSANGSARRK